jgi:hypothetical protein
MKPTISLFLYDPKCNVQSGNGIIKTLQTSLAQDLIKFEHKVNHDVLSETDLKLISDAYQKVYQTLHEINITDIK